MTPACRVGGSSTLSTSIRAVVSTPRSFGLTFFIGFFLAFCKQFGCQQCTSHNIQCIPNNITINMALQLNFSHNPIKLRHSNALTLQQMVLWLSWRRKGGKNLLRWFFQSFLFCAFFMTSDTFLIPTKSTESVTYIHSMTISYMFQCLCTIISENNYVSYFKNQLLLWHCHLWVQFYSF